MMKRVLQHIKEQKYQNLYLFYGKEKYLVAQTRDKLKEALIPSGDTMNYSYFEGRKTDIPEILELIQTMPFFLMITVFWCWIRQNLGRKAMMIF